MNVSILKTKLGAPQIICDWLDKVSDNKKKHIAQALYLHEKHGTLADTLAYLAINAGGRPDFIKWIEVEGT